MSGTEAVLLEHRGVLRAGGEDLVAYLQGIVSNDVARVARERAVWAAFLTPQGKFLHEFFIGDLGGDFLLDCEADRLPDLLRRLTLYRLRSQVTLTDARADFSVAVLFGEGCLDRLGLAAEPGAARPFGGGIVFCDPRLPALGARAILPRDGAEAALTEAGFTLGDGTAYDRLRMSLGVPDGSRDLEVEKSILLENGFDELHGVDWDKGCFMGQELTARTKYRALIKKRLLPVAIEGPAPEPGTPVLAGERQAGVMRSASGDVGLALLRLEYLEGEHEPFTADAARITPTKPDWAVF